MNELAIMNNNEHEVAVAAVSTAVTAEIQSAFTIAKKFPRSTEFAIANIKDSCRNLLFAQKAIYAKPVGGGKVVRNLSVRAAEEIAALWGNIKTYSVVLYDGPDKKIVSITAMDLQTNTSYSTQITINKTVERKNLNGRDPLSTRKNSHGEEIYTVAASEHDLITKTNAAISKEVRNNVLRLIPAHVKIKAFEILEQTLLKRATNDSKEETRNLIDAFFALNVVPETIEELIEIPLAELTPADLVELRTYYTAIKNGSTTPREIIRSRDEKRLKDAEEAEQARLEALKPTTKIDFDDITPKQSESEPKKETKQETTKKPPVATQKETESSAVTESNNEQSTVSNDESNELFDEKSVNDLNISPKDDEFHTDLVEIKEELKGKYNSLKPHLKKKIIKILYPEDFQRTKIFIDKLPKKMLDLLAKSIPEILAQDAF